MKKNPLKNNQQFTIQIEEEITQYLKHENQQIIDKIVQQSFQGTFKNYGFIRSNKIKPQKQNEITTQKNQSREIGKQKVLNKNNALRLSQEQEHQSNGTTHRIRKEISYIKHGTPQKIKGIVNWNMHAQQYDQLADKSLVQYFYTKQKKASKSGKSINGAKIHVRKSKKNTESQVQSRSIPVLNRKILDNNSECNKYDLISCRQSLNELKVRKNASEKYLQALLTQRIGKLEGTILKKIPCLMDMGVRFRKTTHRKNKQN